ncbi:MAG: Stp1/IreP family PP2C-type Ser/Thr phosphatase [Acidimicrobiales bacterium]|nr:Stp1/IreP family PP2C-type Ser/Thr phosphatase [Acidimicrobiales bacterium]
MNISPTRRLRLAWGGATDQGRIRANNQDAMYADSALFVVADGMGGHQGGEVAANLAVRTVAKADRESLAQLRDAIIEANRVVHETAIEQPELHGMGTTLTALAVSREAESPQFVILNVGDSRIYRHRDGQLEQLTEDHSYVAELMRRGELDEDAAAVHPYRNMLTRAIGVHADVEIDEWLFDPVAGDRFMLCSDGVTNELDDSEIAEQLAHEQDPSATAKALVGLANDRGGRDNSTVLIVDVHVELVDSIDEDHSQQDGESQSPIIAPPDQPTLPESDVEEPSVEQSRSSTVKQRSWLYDRVHITLGTLIISVVLLVTSVAMVTTIGWYARSGYHVSVVANHVVIQKGRIGGLLWFEPTLQQWTEIQTVQLTDQDLRRLADGEQMSDLAEAQDFVANLRTRLVEAESGS